jgi:tetratricopeptide (TPR) repeat protein
MVQGLPRAVRVLAAAVLLVLAFVCGAVPLGADSAVPEGGADVPTAIAVADTAGQAAPPAVVAQTPGPQALLPSARHQYQTLNNCGPATAAMVAEFFGHRVSQEAARQALRPGGYDDKNVRPEELASYLAGFGLEARVRTAGSIDRLRVLLANGIPVIVDQVLTSEASHNDVGHFAFVRGYDDAAGVLVTQDPYYGPARRLSYAEFDRLWRAFNRRYIPVYQPQDALLVQAILGEDWDELANWARAQHLVEEEINRAPHDPYAWFNLGDSHLGQGDAGTASHAYERALALGLPGKQLWYQVGPIAAHNRTGNYRRALELAQRALATEATLTEVHYERGVALLGLGQRGAALEAFRQAARYGPTYAPAHEMVAQLSAPAR